MGQDEFIAKVKGWISFLKHYGKKVVKYRRQIKVNFRIFKILLNKLRFHLSKAHKLTFAPQQPS